MPQMAPINWIILFILILMIYLMFNTLNYFLYNPIIKKMNIEAKKFKNLNWKW